MEEKQIYLLIAVVVVLFVLVFLALRKRKKKCVRSGKKKHKGSKNLINYHESVELLLRKKLEEGSDEGEKKSKKDSKGSSVAFFSFKGDIKASARTEVAKIVDEIILNKEQFSEVIVSIESPGGSVTGYGHVYSELERIREIGLPLTAVVDNVAASGGYLACLPANKIMAAPFAIVGSIGVISFIPNIRKLLQKLNIEPRTFTAGDYKRTVTFTDEATEEEIKHFKDQLNLIHEQFKSALKKYRPDVNLDQVATGDHWLAEDSIRQNLGLVDEMKTTAALLLDKNKKQDIAEFKTKPEKKKLLQRIFSSVETKIDEKIQESYYQ